MKNYVLALLLCLGITALSGCKEIPTYMKNPKIENLSQHQLTLLRHIKRSGIVIIKQAMVFGFVIPTDRFFTHDTRELRRHRDKDLFYLAQFLRSYSAYFFHPRITVTAHTDSKVWIYHRERKLLSQHYAQTVGEYLRQGGVPSSQLTVRGVGAENPIASNAYPKGTAYNRRVVVVIK